LFGVQLPLGTALTRRVSPAPARQITPRTSRRRASVALELKHCALAGWPACQSAQSWLHAGQHGVAACGTCVRGELKGGKFGFGPQQQGVLGLCINGPRLVERKGGRRPPGKYAQGGDARAPKYSGFVLCRRFVGRRPQLQTQGRCFWGAAAPEVATHLLLPRGCRAAYTCRCSGQAACHADVACLAVSHAKPGWEEVTWWWRLHPSVCAQAGSAHFAAVRLLIRFKQPGLVVVVEFLHALTSVHPRSGVRLAMLVLAA